MIDQRALDLRRANPMTGHVQHVVDAAEEPEVAVGVDARAVAGEVDAVGPLAEVLLHEALGIAVDAAQHARPRPREREQSAAGRDRARPRRCGSRDDAGKRRAWPNRAWWW